MNYVHELMINNKFEEALSFLMEANKSNPSTLNDIVSLFGRFNEIRRKELLKLLSTDEIIIEKNSIREAILFFGNLNTEQSSHNIAKSLLPEGFLGLGNEPGWSLIISSESIVFVSDYGNKTHAYRITDTFTGKDIWHFRSNKPYGFNTKLISVTITKENWKDSMSGETYPFRVEVIENFRYFLGIGTIKSAS